MSFKNWFNKFEDSKFAGFLKKAFLGLFFMMIFMIFFLTSWFGLVYTHEEAHQEIFKSYGIKSNITINFNPFNDDMDASGWTTPESSEEYHKKCNEICVLSHDLNEAFGYQLAGLMVAMWIMLMFYILAKMYLFDNNPTVVNHYYNDGECVETTIGEESEVSEPHDYTEQQ